MQPERSYHLYTHANGFENLFMSDANYRYFLKRYAHFINPIADTFAYCLMPNHIHFLIRIKSESEILAFGKFKTFQKLDKQKKAEARISKQFANLFSSYTQSFNKMHNRKGSLFIPNFKCKEITSENYFTKVIHYIHANPVHHAFVDKLSDWPWSSYQSILAASNTHLKREEVIKWFGNKNQFLTYHTQPIDIKTRQEMDY